jgi:hypothetical protein
MPYYHDFGQLNRHGMPSQLNEPIPRKYRRLTWNQFVRLARRPENRRWMGIPRKVLGKKKI